MYVGHALIAFVVGLGLAHATGRTGERALAVGLVAAAFGLLPDVDLAYTLYAVVELGSLDVFPTTEHVWTESWLVHRTLTHSLVVGAAVVAFAGAVAVLWRGHRGAPIDRSGAATTLDREGASEPSTTPSVGELRPGARADLVAESVLARAAVTAVAIVLAGSLGVLAVDADGELGAVTMALFLVGAGLVAAVATDRGVPPSLVVVAAAIGIGLHPFGDLWMGRPPIAFYPVAGGHPLPTVRFATDPTLHFLGAVLVEVGLFTTALVAGSRSVEPPTTDPVSPFALLGGGLVVALAVLPAPTFEVAYQFSFAMVGLGAIAGACDWVGGGRRTDPRSLLRTATTVAATMVIGVTAYGVAFVVLGA